MNKYEEAVFLAAFEDEMEKIAVSAAALGRAMKGRAARTAAIADPVARHLAGVADKAQVARMAQKEKAHFARAVAAAGPPGTPLSPKAELIKKRRRVLAGEPATPAPTEPAPDTPWTRPARQNVHWEPGKGHIVPSERGPSLAQVEAAGKGVYDTSPHPMYRHGAPWTPPK